MVQKTQILDKYLTALEKDPTSRVFAPLAEYYRKSGLLSQAIETLNQGIRHNPNYVLGHLGLAFCYFENGDSKRAYDTLNPLIDSNRDNLRMLRLYSDICLELNKTEEALENLKYLLFVNPKDSMAADKVKEIESDNKKFGPIRFNLEDVLSEDSSVSEESKSIQFNIDELDTAMANDKRIDEWTKLDLSSEKEQEIEEGLDSWSMNEKPHFASEPTENSSIEETREFKVEKSIEVDKRSGSSPVITHTLVDLYCNQGYLDKAKDLLEKILELNPNDLKTKLKLQEVERVLDDSFIDESNTLEVVENIKNDQEVSNISLDEDSGRDNLMNLFDKKFSTKEAETDLVEAKSKSSVDLSGRREKVKEIESKLWAFHSALCQKAKTVLSV